MSRLIQASNHAGAEPSSSVISAGLLQRSCDCGQHTSGGEECEECQKKQSTLQRRTGVAAELTSVPPLVGEVLRSHGQPLDSSSRTFMEPRCHQDCSHVRVHADARAAESASAVDAQAYTVGSDVVFASGRYAPQTNAGRRLLAHELTHVVQQHGLARSPAVPEIGPPDDAYEREAEVNAAAVSAGNGARRLASAPASRVQRSVGSAIGSALLDVLLFIPRLFGLEYFPSEDLRNYLAGLKQRKGPQNNLFTDNMARASVSREQEFGPYDTKTKICRIQEMLGGYTSFLHEGAIITLKRRSPSELPEIA